jgi:hypothetical protein
VGYGARKYLRHYFPGIDLIYQQLSVIRMSYFAEVLSLTFFELQVGFFTENCVWSFDVP